MGFEGFHDGSPPFFAQSRTALFFGLKAAKLQAGSRVLVPYYICNEILVSFEAFDIDLVFYDVKKDLTPDWQDLSQEVKNKNINALLMVHYFGVPQDVKKFQTFSKVHNLILIEDNAHGAFGYHKNAMLGSFGDIAIASPRKTLKTQTGGMLYINRKEFQVNIPKLSRASVWPAVARALLNISPKTEIKIRSLMGKEADFESSAQKIPTKLVFKRADLLSEFIIRHYQKESCIKRFLCQRMNMWVWLTKQEKRFGYRNVFDSIPETISPWAFPIYIDEEEKRQKVIEKSKKVGVPIFPWPILPEVSLLKSQSSIKLRNKLICLPLEGNCDDFIKIFT